MKRAAVWFGGILVAVGVFFGWRRFFNAGFGILDRVLLGPAS